MVGKVIIDQVQRFAHQHVTTMIDGVRPANSEQRVVEREG